MSLSTLPPELLEGICELLRPADLKCLRLVSRNLNDVAMKYFLDVVHVDLLPESFDQLLAIAAHPVISSHVRVVMYFPQEFVCCDSFAQYKNRACEDCRRPPSGGELGLHYLKDLNLSNEEWQMYCGRNQAFYEWQQEALESTAIDSTMNLAFASFPKLETVIMANFEKGYPRIHSTHLKQMTLGETLMHPVMPRTGLPNANANAIFRALANPKVKVKYLGLEFVSQSLFQQDWDELASSLARLEFLRLRIKTSQDMDDAWLECFSVFLKLCTGLQRLELFVYGAASVPSTVLGTSFSWPNLEILLLGQFAIQGDQLFDLVTAHQPGLIRVGLQNCFFGDGVQSDKLRNQEGRGYGHRYEKNLFFNSRLAEPFPVKRCRNWGVEPTVSSLLTIATQTQSSV